jgi:hypothetical protein
MKPVTLILIFFFTSFTCYAQSTCWSHTVHQLEKSDCNTNGTFKWTLQVNCKGSYKVLIEKETYSKKKGYGWRQFKTLYFEKGKTIITFKSTGLKIGKSFNYRIICVAKKKKYKDFKNSSAWKPETLSPVKKCKKKK